MKNNFLRIFSVLLSLQAWSLQAQTLHGIVAEPGGKSGPRPVPGASVYWSGTPIAVFTDTSGVFVIPFPDSLPAKLVITLTGYFSDTLIVENRSLRQPLSIVLKSSVKLNEVKVEGRQSSTSISTFSPINAERITSKELLKAACCNLSESFTTNATVDIAFTDAVSGAKKIQMLGLDGVYTQVLSEQIPMIRGLSGAYGINYIPGTWIESILVTKGTGSVVNGFESITGQINVEFKKPQEVKEWLFVNGYGSNKSRMEGNVHLGKKFSDQWSTILFLHASDVSLRNDDNHDGFLDMPLTRQYNVYNRWNYHSGKRIEGQLGLKAIYENRQGGQVSFNRNQDYMTSNAYGLGVETRQLEYFTKTGILFPHKPAQSIGIMTSGKWITMDSYFGLKTYTGDQKSLYVNAIFESFMNNTNHKYKTGLSLMYDLYDEQYRDSAFSRTELVPGIFYEYTFLYGEKFTLVSGIRGDHHNQYGFMVNPRLHFKFSPKPLTAFRVSGGRGFRSPNVFVENAAVFASSRNVIISEKLKPEIAWNTGASITHKFRILNKESSLNVDYFYTDFENQVVVDREDSRVLRFYNLDGKSFSHSFQADFIITPAERLDVKLAYKLYEVKTTYTGELLDKPFVPRNRAMFNVAYSTYQDIWKFDFTLNALGISRISDTKENLPAFRLPEHSKPYFTINTQVTKAFRFFEVYVGAENITDFTQDNPILAADDPFGSNFDASMIWGPVDGRVIYGGFRFKLE